MDSLNDIHSQSVNGYGDVTSLSGDEAVVQSTDAAMSSKAAEVPSADAEMALGIRGLTVEKGARRLRDALAGRVGRGEAEAMVRLIFFHLKGWSASELFMHGGDELSDYIAGKIEEIYARLLTDEPIQYIVGTARFYGMDLEVNRDTLIPRPETEELVDMVVKENPGPDQVVLDACTGSGAIAIALARNLLFPVVMGIDISSGALAVARRNNSRLKTNVDFRQVDIFKYAPGENMFDIIVSNPPYVDESEKSDMEGNVLKWEPATALFVPDDDPLVFYSRLADLAMSALKPGGRIYMEINPRHGAELVAMLRVRGLRSVELRRDIHGRDRFVVAHRPEN